MKIQTIWNQHRVAMSGLADVLPPDLDDKNNYTCSGTYKYLLKFSLKFKYIEQFQNLFILN